MNTFGRILRVSVLGESHGSCIGALVDGCPAGIPLTAEMLSRELARRAPGARGTTRRREPDVPLLETGVFRGRTTGAPILFRIANRDVDSRFYAATRRFPRPSHADLVARLKSGGFEDWRGAGHLSGRLTAALVAAGAIARKVAALKISARVVSINGSIDLDGAIAGAERAGDSVGGIVECVARGLPAGLGEPFFDSVESLVAHAAFAIPGVKGVEFGAGFAAARTWGSVFADPLIDRRGRTATNSAGGVNAGISNGNPLVFRVAVRPASGSAAELSTVDLATGRRVRMVPRGRHDRCIALRVPPVLEAVAAIVLADLMLLEQKVGRVAGKRRRP